MVDFIICTMEEFFSTIGISPNIFNYLVLPLLIFLARIADVSINTIRIIYVLGGRRWIATMLGFFESFIWLMAIRQIFEHLDNWVSYIAYPAGFACGIYVGMLIEERIAFGKVIVRIITRRDVKELLDHLNSQKLRFTQVDAMGPNGNENLVFTVMERERLEGFIQQMTQLVPTAFYTVERVNRATDHIAGINQPARPGIASWLRGTRRL